jgi:hypothetical protein
VRYRDDFAKFPDFAALKVASGSKFAGSKSDDLSGAGVCRSNRIRSAPSGRKPGVGCFWAVGPAYEPL